MQAVAGTAGAGALALNLTAVVGTDIALKAAVVIGLYDVQDVGIAVAVPVRGLGEIAVEEVLYIADVGKGYMFPSVF